MKAFRTALSSILCIVMMLFAWQSTVVSEGIWLNKNSGTYDFTDEDEFVYDCVFAVLDAESSTEFKTYSLADFPEIACKNVTDVSLAAGERVKEKIECAVSAAMRREPLDEAQLKEIIDIDVANYRQILCLELETQSRQSVIDAVRQLEAREDVCYAAPNSKIYMADTVETSGEARGLYTGEQWAHDTISLLGAWSYNTGSSSVRVAVLDTGIDSTHSDLKKRINKGMSRDFVAGQGIGIAEPNPADPVGHGTHVAGIIGAYGNNISGIC